MNSTLENKIKKYKGENYSGLKHFFIRTDRDNAGAAVFVPVEGCYVFAAETEEEMIHFLQLFNSLFMYDYFRKICEGKLEQVICFKTMIRLVEIADSVYQELKKQKVFPGYSETIEKAEKELFNAVIEMRKHRLTALQRKLRITT